MGKYGPFTGGQSVGKRDHYGAPSGKYPHFIELLNMEPDGITEFMWDNLVDELPGRETSNQTYKEVCRETTKNIVSRINKSINVMTDLGLEYIVALEIDSAFKNPSISYEKALVLLHSWEGYAKDQLETFKAEHTRAVGRK